MNHVRSSEKLWFNERNPSAAGVFFRINPETQEEEALLVQKEGREEEWALVGGFQETDAKKGQNWCRGKETKVKAMLREYGEETGLKISSDNVVLHYLGEFIPWEFLDADGNVDKEKYPSWHMSHVYVARLEDPKLVSHPLLAGDDAAEAKWVSIREIKDLKMPDLDRAIIIAAHKTLKKIEAESKKQGRPVSLHELRDKNFPYCTLNTKRLIFDKEAKRCSGCAAGDGIFR